MRINYHINRTFQKTPKTTNHVIVQYNPQSCLHFSSRTQMCKSFTISSIWLTVCTVQYSRTLSGRKNLPRGLEHSKTRQTIKNDKKKREREREKKTDMNLCHSFVSKMSGAIALPLLSSPFLYYNIRYLLLRYLNHPTLHPFSFRPLSLLCVHTLLSRSPFRHFRSFSADHILPCPLKVKKFMPRLNKPGTEIPPAKCQKKTPSAKGVLVEERGFFFLGSLTFVLQGHKRWILKSTAMLWHLRLFG